MSAPLEVPKLIERKHDGARILYRHFMSAQPVEGWVREFSADGNMVRISKTEKPSDAGLWRRIEDYRLISVLEAAKAPKAKASDEEIQANRDRCAGFPDESGELGLGDA